jgi:hypothetical protein
LIVLSVSNGRPVVAVKCSCCSALATFELLADVVLAAADQIQAAGRAEARARGVGIDPRQLSLLEADTGRSGAVSMQAGP